MMKVKFHAQYYGLDEDGDLCSSGLRSPCYDYNPAFCIVNGGGGISTGSASWSAGVRPGFGF